MAISIGTLFAAEFGPLYKDSFQRNAGNNSEKSVCIDFVLVGN